MKKKVFILTGLVVLIVLGIFLFKSTLLLSHASAKFTPYERGMNSLIVVAPYGYYICEYSVVPRNQKKQPFTVGGRGRTKAHLFRGSATHSTEYPSSGGIDKIELEKHVQISKKLDVSATAKLPKNKAILEQCGIYVIITKDQSVYDKIPDIVKNMKIKN